MMDFDNCSVFAYHNNSLARPLREFRIYMDVWLVMWPDSCSLYWVLTIE